MSNALVDRSPDLRRLRDEGYDIEIRANHLLIHQVPYVTAEGAVKRGTLVSPLDLDVDKTRRPSNHQTWFTGEHPCDANGQRIASIVHSSETKKLAEGIEVSHGFSNKPSGGYTDYYAKMIAYLGIITAPARELEPGATAATFPLIRDDDENSPFLYAETASSRAGIRAIADKLWGQKIAIFGAGGSGSYILDFTAKTSVAEIHIFDGDEFQQHTAFRSPGATTADELRAHMKKVDLLAQRYSAMRRGIIPHDYVTEDTVGEIEGFDFAFIAIDASGIKGAIIERLEACGIPFVDVGMGLNTVNNALIGQVRTTASTASMRTHVREKHRIPLDGNDVADDYNQNIQIVELNAMNAALAVIRWKKHFGFYLDLEGEHFSVYQLDGNTIINEDCA